MPKEGSFSNLKFLTAACAPVPPSCRGKSIVGVLDLGLILTRHLSVIGAQGRAVPLSKDAPSALTPLRLNPRKSPAARHAGAKGGGEAFFLIVADTPVNEVGNAMGQSPYSRCRPGSSGS